MKILKYQKYLLAVLISSTTLFACDLGDDSNAISGDGVTISLSSLKTRVAIEVAKGRVHKWCKKNKQSIPCTRGVSIVNAAIDLFNLNHPDEHPIAHITVDS